MLNTEQILIKAAQYFDLNLEKLGIKRSAEKYRFYKHQSEKDTIEYIANKIYKEIESIEINPFIKKIISEFIEYYNYIAKEIYTNYDEKKEKEIDWLLLKHFIIPFFAIRLSQYTSNYDDRIDKGLPGGDFWYSPTFVPNKSKIVFPLNKIMKWLIDLHGGSNQDFYFMKKYDYDENINFNISDSTLKKWHDNFVLPDLKSIKELSSYEFIYDGAYIKDDNDSIEKQFNSALELIQSKSLSIDELKLEVPNLNNILDRLYTDNLSNAEKERFVLYIEQRWAKPTAKQIEYFLLISRVSQACYKDLCNYFNVDVQNSNIDTNNIMQLVNLFSTIYNAVVDLTLNGDSSVLELFETYIYNIDKIQENTKEGLDQIVSSIHNDMELEYNKFKIDEILILFSQNEENRKETIINFEIKKLYKKQKEDQNRKIYEAIEYIKRTLDSDKILKYIYSITDNNVLHNIGDYFQGNNYLTNEIVEPNLPIALTIHTRYSRVAIDLLNKQVAYSKVVNILTFSCYPRMLGKDDVDEWLFELDKISDKNDFRDNLINLSYKGYHLINQKNTTNIISLIEQYIKSVKPIKPQEHNPQFLFIAQDYMLEIGNKKMHKKLKKLNEKHHLFKEHITCPFYFYT